jgi:hypothetical protein
MGMHDEIEQLVADAARPVTRAAGSCSRWPMSGDGCWPRRP